MAPPEAPLEDPDLPPAPIVIAYFVPLVRFRSDSAMYPPPPPPPSVQAPPPPPKHLTLYFLDCGTVKFDRGLVMMTVLAYAPTVTLVSDVGVTETDSTLRSADPLEYFGMVPDADTVYSPPLMTAAGIPVSEVDTPAMVGVSPMLDAVLDRLMVRFTKFVVRSTTVLPDLSTVNVPDTLAPR